MSRIPSYTSPLQLGHRMAAELLDGPVVVQEKIDGSQFSMMTTEGGGLFCRSKGVEINIAEPEGLFAAAVQTAKELRHQLTLDAVYRCEYLRVPKHNTLAYSKIPPYHLVLFDVERRAGSGYYLSPSELFEEARRHELVSAPLIDEGVFTAESLREKLPAWLERESVLGGCKIEGVVIKNYAKIGPDKKLLACKFVSEQFKETHKVEWKKSNPAPRDVVESLIQAHTTEARWRKAAQHLREAGQLTESPKDIGPLLKEIQQDFERECEADIKDRLYAHYRGQFMRGVVRGFPEFYKKTLVEQL